MWAMVVHAVELSPGPWQDAGICPSTRNQSCAPHHQRLPARHAQPADISWLLLKKASEELKNLNLVGEP
jgi:hypothetical protein